MPTYLDDDEKEDWHRYVSRDYHLPEIGMRCIAWNTATISRAIYQGHNKFWECDDQWAYNGFVLKAVTKWRLPREGE